MFGFKKITKRNSGYYFVVWFGFGFGFGLVSALVCL